MIWYNHSIMFFHTRGSVLCPCAQYRRLCLTSFVQTAIVDPHCDQWRQIVRRNLGKSKSDGQTDLQKFAWAESK